MGYGDELMGSGMARGAHARGVKIAFGDGREIKWHEWAHLIFYDNPNVAAPGQERADNLEWIEHYGAVRKHCRPGGGGCRHWIFTPGTQRPGELFFDPRELEFAKRVGEDFVVIEPNIKDKAKQWGAQNKQWGLDRYNGVAQILRNRGFRVVQFNTGLHAIDGIERIATPNFRTACAVLARAALYIGPEGGLHHACAADPVNTPAVVIFGGFVSPWVTGYAQHVNLFTGDDLGCGNFDACEHCRRCMSKISIEQVVSSALRLLK
ncbi:ADP-heptose:LPS heptosyltransferase [Bradyrhizobium sp. USDA 4516]